MAAPTHIPDLLPLLSRGRHRSPRRGACFMELASYLAGERWSDAPRCTDPMLAALARMVNDATSDGARSSLAPMVPAVVGVRGLPATFGGDLALLAVAHSIRDVAATHQRALAVGTMRLLASQRATASAALRARAAMALRDVPDATAWAQKFLGRVPVPRRYSPAGSMLEIAVRGLATACIDDPDGRLHKLLAEAVELARDVSEAGEPPRLTAQDWRGRVRAAV